MTNKNTWRLTLIAVFIIFPAGAVASIYANHPVIGGMLSGAIMGSLILNARNRTEEK